jgi:hypothetical protein
LTQIAPQGPQAGPALTYRWTKDVDAIWYHLWVGRNGVGTWHDRWFEMSGSGEGAANPNGAYPGPAQPIQIAPRGAIGQSRPTFRWSGGACEWWLRGWNPDGAGPWTGPMAFSVPYPAGTWYRVYASQGATKVVDQWVQNAELVSPVALALGAHAWWLGVWDAQSSRTIWSDRINFTVRAETDQ